jgi:hypothetical protein
VKVYKFAQNLPILNRKLKYLLLVFIFAGFIPLFFPRCANIIPPTGGPRDTIPPVVLNSSPQNFSTRVAGKEIRIEFDEFIELRNINQQFIITPPQRERPEFRVRGRNLFIDLNTDLIANTTYTLNFGNAIVDLNEGNPLANYEFVFSTGDVIDSLSYSGIVLDAYTNQPVEGAVVMLYDQLQDSIPYLQMPLYAIRTGKDGRFRMNNLRSDTFKVFALKDENNNYLYDRPGEEAIAFLENYISPDTTRVEAPAGSGLRLNSEGDHHHDHDHDHDCDDHHHDLPDPDLLLYNILNDTIHLHDHSQCDSICNDSHGSNGYGYTFNFSSGDTLYLFREEAGRQYIRRSERSHRGKLLIIFNLPLKGDWSVEPLNFEPRPDWKLIEINNSGDSLHYWITDPEIQNTDNLRLLVSYMATGPSDSLKQVSDTLNMNYTAPRATRRQEQDDEARRLEPEFGIRPGGNHELNRDLVIKFPEPLVETELSGVRLVTEDNDQFTTHEFELISDSLRIRNYYIKSQWLPDRNYRFMADPGSFTGIFGTVSDTIDFNFRTRAADYYSTIALSLTGVDGHMIIQLLDEQENIIDEVFLSSDSEVVFDYLPIRKYRIKAIFDENENRRWDTGNYLRGIQPERVIYFNHGDVIATRSHWIITEEWDLSEN